VTGRGERFRQLPGVHPLSHQVGSNGWLDSLVMPAAPRSRNEWNSFIGDPGAPEAGRIDWRLTPASRG